MLRKALVILVCVFAGVQMLHAQYTLFFLENEEFTSSLEPWMTCFENRAGHSTTPGTAEWSSDYDGSAHLVVSGSPSVVGVGTQIGTTLYPGDTVWMRVTSTDMTGFGHTLLTLGAALPTAEVPFQDIASVPDGAGTWDVALVCSYFHGPGTALVAMTVVWPGSGEVWIDYIRLSRADGQSVLIREGGRSQLPTRPPMMGRAYPSPTTGPVSMAYNLVRPAKTEVSIFDLSGSLVKRLESPGTVGVNHAVWNGTDEQGRGVAAGVYYYSVKAENAPVASGKVTLTR